VWKCAHMLLSPAVALCPRSAPHACVSLEILPCVCGPLSTFVIPTSLRVFDLCPKGAVRPCISLEIVWLVAAGTTVTHLVMAIAYTWHTHDMTWKGRRDSLVRAGAGHMRAAA